jgi:hypothetical protein
MSAKKLTEDQQHQQLLKAYGLGHYSKEDFGMKIGDHKFIVAVMRDRDEALKDEIMEAVSKAIAPYNSTLERIENKIDTYDARIFKLETGFQIQNTVLEGHTALIASLNRMMKWYTFLSWSTAAVSLGTLIFVISHIMP